MNHCSPDIFKSNVRIREASAGFSDDRSIFAS